MVAKKYFEGMTCTVEVCDKKPVARGLCIGHYARWKKYGTPHQERPFSICSECATIFIEETPNDWVCPECDLEAARVDKSILEYMESKAIPGHRPLRERYRFGKTGWDVSDTGCWEWRGKISPEVKGNLSYALFNWGRGAGRLAHRWSYMNRSGVELKPSQVVRHDCDNPKCVNPDHLRVGTQADNIRDMWDRGRANVRKYSDAQLELSCVLVLMYGKTHAEASRQTGVDPATIGATLREDFNKTIMERIRNKYDSKLVYRKRLRSVRTQ